MANDVNEVEEEEEEMDDLNTAIKSPLVSPVLSPTSSDRQLLLVPPMDETFTIDSPSEIVQESSPEAISSKKTTFAEISGQGGNLDVTEIESPQAFEATLTTYQAGSQLDHPKDLTPESMDTLDFQ